MKKISINPLTNYLKASERRRLSIIKQAKKSDAFITNWYASAKSSIRKSILNGGDTEQITDGLAKVNNTVPISDWQRSNKFKSIEVLQRFLKINLPKFIKEKKFSVLKKPDRKYFINNGIEVIVSPDFIFEIEINGIKNIGGLKLHASDSGKFDSDEGRFASSVIYKYLKSIYDETQYIVNPEFCISIDIFSERVNNAVYKLDQNLSEIENLCKEINKKWDLE